MSKSVATIKCANPHCQRANPLDHKFCQQCSTPIVKRYLWLLGGEKIGLNEGELLGDRYLVVQPHVILDTQPASLPSIPAEIPSYLKPYLNLSSYRLHIPQIYGQLTLDNDQVVPDAWLLEYGTVPLNSEGNLAYSGLLPRLTDIWQQSTGLRQLNWLWQMAQLWQPLFYHKAAATLLNPDLLRVNGNLLQLLELDISQQKYPDLTQLGQLWSQWIETADRGIKEFLVKICDYLAQHPQLQPDRLIAILDQALRQYGQSRWQRKYQIYTLSDVGTVRHHNEDACYPPIGIQKNLDAADFPLAIVCDGLGGHEGGEVASKLAINYLQEAINNLTSQNHNHSPQQLSLLLERFVCAANDKISDRNDSEHRQERQRMGTTLVMGLAYGHEIYLTHVGDSRIYWITATGCHQVTVDDDLASREVRLGYSLYRDALQYPNGGALIQAVGMGRSQNLHPNVQRLILDQDSIFLLCSDGLSDFDRVDQYWRSEILPLLEGTKNIAEVAKNLIAIANEKNGHDNSTIALVYCQAKPITAVNHNSKLDISLPENPVTISTAPNLAPTLPPPTSELSPITERQGKNKPILALTLTSIIFIILAIIGYLLFPLMRSVWQQKFSTNPDNNGTVISQTSTNSSSSINPHINLIIGDFVQIKQEITLLPTPNPVAPDNSDGVGKVPATAILKVAATEPDQTWIQFKICQIPAKSPQNPAFLPPGNLGWLNLQGVSPEKIEKLTTKPTNFQFCPVSSQN